MRNIAKIVVAITLIGSACASPFGNDELAEEISTNGAMRMLLPAAIPEGFKLSSYGGTLDNERLYSLYVKGDTIVILCVALDADNLEPLGCEEGSPKRELNRGLQSVIVEAGCASEECDTRLVEWVQRFGEKEPTADQAVRFLDP